MYRYKSCGAVYCLQKPRRLERIPLLQLVGGNCCKFTVGRAMLVTRRKARNSISDCPSDESIREKCGNDWKISSA